MLWFFVILLMIIAPIVANCVKHYREREDMMADVHQCHGWIVKIEPIKASRMGEGPGGVAYGPNLEVTTIRTYQHYSVTTGYKIHMLLDDGTRTSFRSLPRASIEKVPGVGVASTCEMFGTMYYVTDKKGVNYYTDFVHDPYKPGTP